jgi:hypothetical protein
MRVLRCTDRNGANECGAGAGLAVFTDPDSNVVGLLSP